MTSEHVLIIIVKRGWTGGRGTGIRGAEAGVEGSEAGVEGRGAGVDGVGSGDRGGGIGRGVWNDWAGN